VAKPTRPHYGYGNPGCFSTITAMPEPKHEDVSEPTDEHVVEPTDEDEAEPTDEDEADSGRHRSGRRPRSSWLAAAALLIAVVALAGAAWALFRPSWLPSPPNMSSTSSAVANQPIADSNTSPRFTDQQVADARGRACDAFNTVSQALSLQTQTDVGKDPAALLAKASNARLSMIGGGQYLLQRLDPATPAPLAAANRTYGDQLEDIGMRALAGTSNDDPAQAARQHDIEATNAQIVDLCK